MPPKKKKPVRKAKKKSAPKKKVESKKGGYRTKASLQKVNPGLRKYLLEKQKLARERKKGGLNLGRALREKFSPTGNVRGYRGADGHFYAL